jgi:type IV pilus assembly protein PilE
MRYAFSESATPMVLKRSSGFTLLELLITVVVIGILAAIAIPSYSAYITRGQRAAAKAALEQGAQFLERIYTGSGCYDFGNAADCTARGGTSAVSLPAALTVAPTDGGPATYAITVDFTPAAGFAAGQYFILTATPTVTDTDCGALTLNNTGEKGATNPATCWGR